MKKRTGRSALVLGMALGMSMLITGCGGRVNGVNQQKMIDKYASYVTLGDYKGIAYEWDDSAIPEDAIQSNIESKLSEYKTSETLTTQKVENGDTVNIDYVGSIDGVPFEGGNTNGQGADLTLGSGSYIPGFEDSIVGHKVGESFDINVTFPEDYGSTDLAGKDAVFAITINSATRESLPELTDDFIAEHTDSKTLAEYKEATKKEIIDRQKEYNESSAKRQVVQKLVEETEIGKYPEEETKRLIDQNIKQIEDAAAQYNVDFATYVTTYYGYSSEDAFKEYLSGMVSDFIKEKSIICAVAKAEGIKATQDDVDAYVEKLMSDAGFTDKDEIKKYYTDEDLLYYALAEKVAQFLVDNGAKTSPTDAEAQ